MADPFRYSRGRGFVSVSVVHRYAENRRGVCTHSLIVRWRDGWRGIVWQVER